jgi:hypothetical protein
VALDFVIPPAAYTPPTTALNFWIRDLTPGAPVVDPAAFSVSEGASIGTVVGAVTGDDPNDDPLTWSITAGNTGGAFAIGSSTGVITVAAALDYETLANYALTVTASDGTGRSGSATITIAVTDVAEVALEPAPSHILGVGLPWARSAQRERALGLVWRELEHLDVGAALGYVDAPALDAGAALVWNELAPLDLAAGLLWTDQAARIDARTGLAWRDPARRDVGAGLAWDERWKPRDAETDLAWRNPAIKDRQVTVLYREVDLAPPAGDWFALPAEAQPGAGIVLDWPRRGFDIRVRLTDAYSQPVAGLDFRIPVLPPDEPAPPVLLSWAPIRAPQLQPVAVDALHGLPWSVSPAKDRISTLRWGRGQPVSSEPIEIPWESELPEPTWIVVPPLRAYNVSNSISVVRLPERTPINPLAVSVSWDDEAYAWQVQMTLFSASEMALLSPVAGLKEVEVTINGWVVIAAIESYSRDRQFPKMTWTVQGRSRHCYLDAPYSRPRSLVSTGSASAAQLALDELPSGWTLNWNVPDWVIPAGAWSYDQLTPIKAIGRLAAAAGAVLEPDPATKTITVRSRYPVSPSGWAAATPYATLPEALCTRMGETYQAGEARNAVIVEGATQGVRVVATRLGTAGDDPLPNVTEQLCTAVECGMERARVELAATGATLDQVIAIPVLPSPSVIRPGRLLEVQDTPATWRGLVRSVAVSAARSKEGVAVGQTLNIERRAA